MNDIERAMMVRRKGLLRYDFDSSQTSSTSSECVSVDSSISTDSFDSDIDIGIRGKEWIPDAGEPDTNILLTEEPVNGETKDPPKTKEQICQSRRIFKSHDLPLEELEETGFLTPNTPKSQITEEYRRIKRPLLKRLDECNDETTAGNVIAVTSAMTGEGKTFSAINLAMSLAREKDRTVLLIDADVVRHTAGRVFGVSSEEIGLLDLLEDEAISASDITLETNVERLHFLPAGRQHSNASELLSSDRMLALITDVSTRFENCIVVIDCPPIMQTNEAAILVDHAGQIVFVVAEEQTSQGVVVQALKLIGDEKKVGILLNKSTTRLGHYDYYSYAYS